VIIAPSGGNVGVGVAAPLGMLSNSNSMRSDENFHGLGSMALNWTGVSSGYVAAFENFATGGLGHGVLVRTADTSTTGRALNIITGGTSRFSVNGDGRVIVGQSSTSNLFTVGGPSKTLAGDATIPYDQSHLTIQGTGNSRTPGIGAALGFVVPANTDGSNSWEQGRILVTPDNGNNGDAQGRMYIQTRTTGGNWPWRNNLTLLSNGNVGINDTTPLAPLSVGGPNGAFISTHTAAASNYLAGAFGSGMHWDGANWISRGDGGSNGGGMMAAQKSGTLNFYSVPNTSGSNRVIPDSDIANFTVMSMNADRSTNFYGGLFVRGGAPGANGINHNGYSFTSPGDNDSGLYSLADGEVSLFSNSAERLKINFSGATFNTDVTARNLALGPPDNSYRGSIYFGYMNDPNHRLYNNFLNQDGEGAFDGIKWNLLNGIRFRTLSGGAVEAMRIDANGRIGMGVTTLTEKLEVAGSVKADAFLYNSDSRLKKNISTIENPLDKIMKLRGVNFTWKNSNQKTVGFIAQEVEKVVPELVKTNSQTTLKSVHYSNIIAIVVEAIKELRGENKREVANLKEENKKLKTKVESLEERLKRLEEKTAVAKP
jgi:hypothetical protein